MDTLAQFLNNVNPATVEAERLGSYEKARGESFSNAPHRAMLAHHEIEKARFKSRLAENEIRLMSERSRAQLRADAERAAAYKKYQAEKRAS